MIKSNFIADVVDLLLDSDADGIALRPQIPLLTDTLYGYTSGGMFVTFSHFENITAHKSIKDDLILKGVNINAPGFDFEAEATLYFAKGIIDHLSISCSQGAFPRQDLAKYTLIQTGDSGRKIIKE